MSHGRKSKEGGRRAEAGEVSDQRVSTWSLNLRDEAGRRSCGLWGFRHDLKQTKASLPSQKPWPRHACLQKGFLEPETTPGSKDVLREGAQERPTSK